MLPTLNQYIYLALEPDGGCRAIEAQLNVMHAAFLSIQTASQLDDDSLLKGKQVFQTLFSKHFSEDIEVGHFLLPGGDILSVNLINHVMPTL